MKPSKTLITLLYSAIICLLIVSCGTKSTGTTTVYTPKQIADVIIAGQTEIPALIPLTPNDDLFAEYLSGNYMLDAGDFEDGAVYYAFGAEASEITVLLLRDSAEAKKTADALLEYKERRISALTGYVPGQAALAESGVVITHGAYTALLICGDTAGAESAFLSCFGSDPPKLPSSAPPMAEKPSAAVLSPDDETRIDETPADEETDHSGDAGAGPQTAASPSDDPAYIGDEGPTADTKTEDENNPPPAAPGDARETAEAPETYPSDTRETGNETDGSTSDKPGVEPGNNEPGQDRFDPAAILAAWNTGDAALLTPKNQAILNACAEIIGEVIKDDMTVYEKELAIHDRIVLQAAYDTEANNNSPNAKPSPDNDNPYGLLFYNKAICSGYTSTFQLFMDMLGIECITVNGYARNRDTNHAWNMVRLDGQWYCVDVTWDDPVGAYDDRYISHEYFNVTSQYLRNNLHIWDESGVPEAAAAEYSWESMSGG